MSWYHYARRGSSQRLSYTATHGARIPRVPATVVGLITAGGGGEAPASIAQPTETPDSANVGSEVRLPHEDCVAAAPLQTVEPANAQVPEDAEAAALLGRLGVLTLRQLKTTPNFWTDPVWVVPGLFQDGSLTAFAAREKGGKSTLLAWIVSRISRGEPIFGDSTKRGPVLWIGLEEDRRRAGRRFDAMRAEDETTFVLKDLPKRGRFRALAALVRAIRPSLVVIDSLIAYAAGRASENSSARWNRILDPIRDLAYETGTSIVMLAHSPKSGPALRGSGAIAAAFDTVLVMEKVEGDPTARKITGEGRWQVDQLRIRYDLQTMNWSIDASAPAGDAPPADLKAAVLALLGEADRGMTVTKLREAIEARGIEVDAAIHALEAEGSIVHLGKRAGYVLSERVDEMED